MMQGTSMDQNPSSARDPVSAWGQHSDVEWHITIAIFTYTAITQKANVLQ